MVTSDPVLVLNQNYQPLNVCNVKRAFVLLALGKAELMENGRGYIRSVTRSFPAPSVIRLFTMVKRPMVQRRLSRRAVFYRDRFMCLYCGTETKMFDLGPRHAPDPGEAPTSGKTWRAPAYPATTRRPARRRRRRECGS